LAAYIHHREGFVQEIIQVIDIISWIGQNKNTLACPPTGLEHVNLMSYGGETFF
jgi:hypothetical protein